MPRGKTISVLNIKVSLDADELARGTATATVSLGKIGDNADMTGGAVKRFGEGFDRLGTKIAGAVAFLGNLRNALAGAERLFGQAVAAARSFAQTIGDIDSENEFAARIGISIQELQALQFAFSQNGVGANVMNTALQRMVRRISDASQGTGEAVKALGELGLLWESFDGRLSSPLFGKTPDEQVAILADAFAGLQDKTREQALAMKLFDTEGVALINLLRQGSGAVNQLKEEAIALNRVMGVEQVEAAAAAQASFVRMNAAFESVRRNLATTAAPFLEEMAQTVTEFTQTLVDFIEDHGDDFRQIFSDVTGDLENMVALARSFLDLFEIAGLGPADVIGFVKGQTSRSLGAAGRIGDLGAAVRGGRDEGLSGVIRAIAESNGLLKALLDLTNRKESVEIVQVDL